MKYRIYRIWVVGKRVVLRQETLVDNIQKFRQETAVTFRVPTSCIKLQYDHLEELWTKD